MIIRLHIISWLLLVVRLPLHLPLRRTLQLHLRNLHLRHQIIQPDQNLQPVHQNYLSRQN